MPRAALIPDRASRIEPLEVEIGFPDSAHRLSLTVGGEPKEDGVNVTDHAVAREERVTLTGIVSDYPASGGVVSDWTNALEAWNGIRRLHKSLTTVTVVTPLGTYYDMLISRVDAAEHGVAGFRATFELSQIIRIGDGANQLPAGQLGGPAAERPGAVEQGALQTLTDLDIPDPLSNVTEEAVEEVEGKVPGGFGRLRRILEKLAPGQLERVARRVARGIPGLDHEDISTVLDLAGAFAGDNRGDIAGRLRGIGERRIRDAVGGLRGLTGDELQRFIHAVSVESRAVE